MQSHSNMWLLETLDEEIRSYLVENWVDCESDPFGFNVFDTLMKMRTEFEKANPEFVPNKKHSLESTRNILR